jgi:5-methylcytosine-specific restriction endonuclease McrA
MFIEPYNVFINQRLIMSSEQSNERLDRIVAQARRDREEREKGYREQALKLYPWVCGRCAREFSRENLRELTVHHRDHNHDNNPSDGSNWELLCVYCHDNEHSRLLEADAGYSSTEQIVQSASTYKPFGDLADLLKQK